MARHRLQHLKQNDMPMHEYISKFANHVEHAYGLSSTEHSSFILASTFTEGILNPHIRNKLRSCKAQSLQDVFSQAILEDQKQKLRALDFETPRADSIAHCEVNAIRSVNCYRCGSTSHLVRECPVPAEPPQVPANNRVKQLGNDNNTSNDGNIQDPLTAIKQALQALTNKIDKMHTPTQKSYHTNNYNKSHGHNRPHNHNKQHHSRYQHKQHNKHKQQKQIAEVEACDCEECNHCPDDCTDCGSTPITSNNSPNSETLKN